jgi:hypothetical protein
MASAGAGMKQADLFIGVGWHVGVSFIGALGTMLDLKLRYLISSA